MEGTVRIVSFYNQPWVYAWLLALIVVTLFFCRKAIIQSFHITSVWALQKTRVFTDMSQTIIQRLLPIFLFCSLLTFVLYWLFLSDGHFSYITYFAGVGALIVAWAGRWLIRKLVAFVFMPPKDAVFNMSFYRNNLLLWSVVALLVMSLLVLSFPHFSKLLCMILLCLLLVLWLVVYLHNLFAFFVQKPIDVFDSLFYTCFVELLPIVAIVFLFVNSITSC